MNRRLFGVVGVLTIAALPLGSCKSDPLSELDGSPAALVTDFDLVRVAVGDTVSVTATVYDARSTPLEVPVTFTPCSGVATAVIDPDYHPVPATSARALIIGSTLGETCVVASAAGLQDTVDVMTFPATLLITGGPANDSIPSGAVTQFGFQFLDHQGNPLSGLPDPVFTTNDTNRAAARTPTGAVQGKAPGPVVLTATGVGVNPAGITGTRSLTVVAGTFLGGVTPTAVSPGDTVTLTADPAGPGFDADTRVDVKGVRAFTFGITAGSMKFVVPATGVTGSVLLALSNMGPGQAAQNGTLTSNTASLDDPYGSANDDPATAPAITANGDYFVIQHGTCKDGAVTDPGDDCDDFFKVTNSGAVVDTVNVRLDWFTAGTDVDILWCRNVTCTSVTTGGGATAANPENSQVVIPAGATWYLWINYFDPSGAPSTLSRVRMTNKNP
jgi:hypothetical protein